MESNAPHLAALFVIVIALTASCAYPRLAEAPEPSSAFDRPMETRIGREAMGWAGAGARVLRFRSFWRHYSMRIPERHNPMACLPDVVKGRRSLSDAVLLLAIIAQGEADVRAGRTRPHADVFADLRARLMDDPDNESGRPATNDP